MSESDKTDRNKGKSKSKNKKKSGCSWALRVFLLAVALSALLSFFSSTALEGTGYAVAIIVLAVFIALGIVFDMIGVAVTAALTALISGITIGGKALGKTVAINECTGVVYRVARLMHTLHLYR
mgnify:CR=1 FL=1